MNIKKSPYIVLFTILIAVGMSGAYALEITLSADFIELLGILDMNTNKIINVGDPTEPTDAATKAYVDSSSGVDTLALLSCTTDQVPSWDGLNWVCADLDIPPGILNMNNNKITNVINPTDPVDVATKAYVDSMTGGTIGLSGCISNQVPVWDGLNWVCANLDIVDHDAVKIISSTANVGWYTSIAIGTDGNPVISYFDFPDGALIVTHCGNIFCSAGNTLTTVDTLNSVGLYTSIAIGTDGNPVVSYYDQTNDDLKVVHCGNTFCSAGNTITILDSTGDVGKYTSIAIGADNNPIISYLDQTNIDLKVVHCGNTSCSAGNTITILDSEGFQGYYPSIAIGADNQPVISYFDGTAKDLKVVHCGNTSCSAGNTITTVDSAGDIGLFTSMVIGLDNNPVISYYDQLNSDLKVVHCGNTSCSAGNTITILDNDTSVGKYTSIAIGIDNKPIISYQDLENSDLKLAHCGNPTCSDGNTVTTVDSTGLVGRYTSIAIGSDFKPVISYYEDQNQNLKVAHCGSLSVCLFSIAAT